MRGPELREPDGQAYIQRLCAAKINLASSWRRCSAVFSKLTTTTERRWRAWVEPSRKVILKFRRGPSASRRRVGMLLHSLLFFAAQSLCFAGAGIQWSHPCRLFHRGSMHTLYKRKRPLDPHKRTVAIVHFRACLQGLS